MKRVWDEMGRMAGAIAAVLVVGLLVAGCSGAVGDGQSAGDGLHKTVPPVVGMSQKAASDAIIDAGYEVGSVQQERVEGAEEGTVVRQEPVGGTSLPRGREINLVVASE